ncbi:MAG: imidazole glycerol phosphate synthase subunit HisF [Myxococcota bacterium]
MTPHLSPRLIPCLDVKDGRVVKGVRFQGLRDAGDPVALATAYAEQGADELVLLDVSATPEGRGHGLKVVDDVRKAIGIPLTVGGGVRTVADAGRLLDAGADKVGVNTAAVAEPDLLTRLADQFGTQCVVLALDAAQKAPEASSGVQTGPWCVTVRSGRERLDLDAVEWAATAEAKGAGEILLTSWDRDGTGSGYNLALIRAIREAVNVPVIASGGAAHAGHLAEALDAGADAVLAASIFHDGVATVTDVKERLREAGVVMRTKEP